MGEHENSKPSCRSSSPSPSDAAKSAPTADDEAKASSSSAPSAPLVELLEGFFRYYLHFPLESQAVSIWRGKPIMRKTGFLDLACDENGDEYPQLPRITREEREELYEPTENGSGSGSVTPSVRSTRSSNETDPEEVERREKEAQAAGMAKIEALLRAEGVEDLALSLEEKSKLSKAAVEGQDGQGGPESSDKPAQLSKPTVNGSNGSKAKAKKVAKSKDGLSIDDAIGPDQTFPFPEMENPETFVEPSHWNQRLVVQDPFIHTRNTTMNIQPHVVQRIMNEFGRALELIEAGAPLQEICWNSARDKNKKRIQQGMEEQAGRRAERRAQRQVEGETRRNPAPAGPGGGKHQPQQQRDQQHQPRLQPQSQPQPASQ